jgi:hypothetical protein
VFEGGECLESLYLPEVQVALSHQLLLSLFYGFCHRIGYIESLPAEGGLLDNKLLHVYSASIPNLLATFSTPAS